MSCGEIFQFKLMACCPSALLFKDGLLPIINHQFNSEINHFSRQSIRSESIKSSNQHRQINSRINFNQIVKSDQETKSFIVVHSDIF